MSMSPFLGALSDKIGAKYISVVGVFLMGVALMLYTLSHKVYPDLLLFRMFFAFAATAAASMMTAMLAELSASGFDLKSLFKWNELVEEDLPETQEQSEELPAKRNGKLTSVIGIATGCGAVFSVSVYLPLPAKFGLVEPPKQALKHSYLVIGMVAIVSSFLLSFGLFSSKRFRIPWISKYLTPYDDVLEALEEEEAQTATEELGKSYLDLLKLGFAEAQNTKIALAYFGGFVARSTTIVTSVFIPLYVNKHYYSHGICVAGEGTSCREAYVQAAILTGIAHTVSLVFAPIFGYICDTYGRKNSLLVTTVFGIISSFGFAFASNPKSVAAVVMCCFIGAAQIGHIITSMSLCTDKQRAHNGAISGVYGLCGGLGILIISKVGGYSADYWMGAPFVILAAFNVFLMIVTLFVGHKFDFLIQRISLPDGE